MMKSEQTIKQISKLINTGKSIPAVKLINDDPMLAAVLSKAVQSANRVDNETGHSNVNYGLNRNQLNVISENTQARNRDSENILQLFPDIELAIQIIVSSILSPKDMVNTVLNYKSKEVILPSELTLKLNNLTSSHLENYYEIKKNLRTILTDVLFLTGSYAVAAIPEGLVDELINADEFVSTESIKDSMSFFMSANGEMRSLGLLGNAKATPDKNIRPGLESFSSLLKTTKYNPYLEDLKPVNDTEVDWYQRVEITDNYNVLRLPEISRRIESNHVNRVINFNRQGIGVEHYNNEHQIKDILFKRQKAGAQDFVAIPHIDDAKRKSIGRPLVMRFPSESVIPIFTPGDETQHIGYYILLDADGYPISKSSNRQYMEGLNNIDLTNNSNSNLSSVLLQRARNNLHKPNESLTIDQITRVYGKIVEKDLIDRLKNGYKKGNVEIGDNQEIYRIMLARSFANKYTRLLYIPAELVTYFAFKYHDNGIGKSYLDEVSILTSLRAILLFAKVMALTKNSIAQTHVNMHIDPRDPDPKKSIEMAMHEIFKMRQLYFPVGINNPVDLVDWIQRAGVDFSFEGHPMIPETKFDFETRNLQHNVPNDELDELLRKLTYMHFGLSPETVDNGLANPDFATTIVSNNVLLSKRISLLGDLFSEHTTDYAKKILSTDQVYLKELKDVLLENKGLILQTLSEEDKAKYGDNDIAVIEGVIKQYLDNLLIELPKPDITSVENLSTAFDQFEQALDKMLDYWISPDIITSDLSGKISDNISSIRATLKAYFIRKWSAENGYLSELSDIVTSDEDGHPNLDIFEIIKGHSEAILKSSLNLIHNLQPSKNAADKDLDTMDVEPGETPVSSDSGSDSGGLGDGGFSFDEMNLDDMGEDTGGESGTDEGSSEDSSDDTTTVDTDENKTDETKDNPL